jgi:hypothetical protein
VNAVWETETQKQERAGLSEGVLDDDELQNKKNKNNINTREMFTIHAYI